MSGRTTEYYRLLNALKDEGYRITGPRRALLRLLANSAMPLSIQEIHAAVNEELGADADEEEINLVTIYRFTSLLVDLKLLRRVELGQGYARYEREEPQNGPHHHHLVCERCGKIEDFHGCDLANLIGSLERERGFVIARHQLELYGTCPACQGS